MKCEIPGCNNITKSKKMLICSSHYNQLNRTGELKPFRNPEKRAKEKCGFPGCNNKLQYRNPALCNSHYYQIRRGTKLKPLYKPEYDPICSAEGCEKESKTNGFCIAHEAQMRRNGKTRPLSESKIVIKKVLIDESLGSCEVVLGASGRSTTEIYKKNFKEKIGRKPLKDHVCGHKCDIRFCREKTHLEEITQRQNMWDAHERSRYNLFNLPEERKEKELLLELENNWHRFNKNPFPEEEFKKILNRYGDKNDTHKQ